MKNYVIKFILRWNIIVFIGLREGETPWEKELTRSLNEAKTITNGAKWIKNNNDYEDQGYKEYLDLHSRLHLTNEGTIAYLSQYTDKELKMREQKDFDSNYSLGYIEEDIRSELGVSGRVYFEDVWLK